jgi:uncharacterized protein with HEPN domain
MPRYSEREEDWIEHIAAEAKQALDWIEGLDFDGFCRDALRVAAVERKLSIVTEACLRIERNRKEPGRFAELFGSGDISDIRGMGNRIRHLYEDIDPQIVFETVRVHFPELVKRAESLLASQD